MDLYGRYKAKVHLTEIDRLQGLPNGNYVVVTGITPTPLGEGKTTTALGLSQALCAHLNKPTFCCIRQSSMGPTFGIKGGAAGGGYSQVIPMEEFNFHLTGDIHAVTVANNLIAAALDARILHEKLNPGKGQMFDRLCPINVVDGNNVRKPFSAVMQRRLAKLGIRKTDPEELTIEERERFSRLNIDPRSITWNRVVDTSDRFLRCVDIGLNHTEGLPRRTQFDIAVASELMAIVSLSTSLEDMYARVQRIVVACDYNKVPITVDDLGVTGAVVAMLRDTLMPTLMQSLEGTPVLVHTGPFANIAHGNSSIIADKIALKLVGSDGFVITEAGFSSDIGFEKYCNIKCRKSGLKPDCAVLVATVRAIKQSGGLNNGTNDGTEALAKGLCNLEKHIQIIRRFGVPVVVAVNAFSSDDPRELATLCNAAVKFGALSAQISTCWARGGEGALALAESVSAACDIPSRGRSHFRYSYSLDTPIKDKIECVAKDIYGAGKVSYSKKAEERIEWCNKNGFDKLPVCFAKTQLSLSHDPMLVGAPKGFVLPVRDVRASVGAGFVYPIVGEISTMPGLGSRPCFYDIDIDPKTQKITGLI